MHFSTRSLTIVHLFGCAIVVSHENNKKNSRFHERYLRIIYNDKRSPFNALLEKDCSVLIHERKHFMFRSELVEQSLKFDIHNI